MVARYDVKGVEAEFEPGSRGRVLRNLQGIRSAREMARRESEALLLATQQLIDNTELDQTFTCADICRMHALWLGVDLFVGRAVPAGQCGQGWLHVRRGWRSSAFDARVRARAIAGIYALPNDGGRGASAGIGGSACRAGADTSVPRRQRTLLATAYHADGVAGRTARAGFQRRSRHGKAALHCCGTDRAGSELRADDGRFQAHHQADATPVALTLAAGQAGFSGLGGQ